MFRAAIVCFVLFLATVTIASILDHFHLVVFGPCAGPGETAIFGALFLSASLGVIFTLIGSGIWLARKLRQPR
jgi:hypothetical protein